MRKFALAALMPVICLAQAQSRPRIVVDALAHDFGKVERDSTVSHRFRITNAGDAPLRITSVKASCGCTSSVVGKDTLAPGEETGLDVAFDTTGIRGKARKTVEVFSDDPSGGVQILTVEAEVALDVRVSQEEVLFEDLGPRDRRKATVRLASNTGRPLQVSDVELSKAPWLGVATREQGNDVLLDLELAADRLPKGINAGMDRVDLYVVNPRTTQVGIRVRWQRRLPIAAAPARLALAGAAGQGAAGNLKLKNALGKPFRVLAARTTSSFLDVPALPERAGTAFALRVVLSPEAPAGTYDEKIILTLDDPAQPSLEVRVAAVLK